jgi:pentose-5-phosphate-3-epimerase
MTDKIARLARMIVESGSGAEIEVDGGIDTHTAPEVVAAGARVLVAGSAIYNSIESVREGIRALQLAVAAYA